MKTTFPRAYLAACSHFMAKKDIRYYLQGLLVESLINETRLAATNGCVAAVLRHCEPNEDTFDLIIPMGIVDITLKMPGVMCVLECLAGKWSIDGMPFTPVDGKFPDYRHIVPSNCSGEAACGFNPDLLAKFAKAGKELGHKGHPIVRQNGKDVALVHFYDVDHFVGVISPFNHFTSKFPDLGFPTWGNQR